MKQSILNKIWIFTVWMLSMSSNRDHVDMYVKTMISFIMQLAEKWIIYLVTELGSIAQYTNQ